MLCQLWLTYKAILKTGILGKYPYWNLWLFLWCYMCHKRSLYTLAAWSAQRFPDSVALAEPHYQITYKALLKNSDRLAVILKHSLHLQPKQTIGLLCKNRIIFVEVLLACSKLGVNVLLLNTLALDQIEHSDFLNSDLLICDSDYQPMIEKLPQDKPLLKVVYTSHLEQLLDSSAQNVLNRVFRCTNPTGKLILLTSGSTGKAKVVKTHLDLYQRLTIFSGLLEQLHLRVSEPTLLTTPLVHGQGLATLACSLAMAAPLYIQPNFEVQAALTSIKKHHIKVLVMVPTLLYRLLEYLHVSTNHDTSSLRVILCGSAPLSADLAKRSLEILGPILYNLYGASEIGIISIATPQHLREAPASVGKVLPELQVGIDKNNNEIQIYNRHGQIIYHTGDAGFIDKNGRLFLQGRLDEMLICGGQNIYPQMIEEKLSRALPYVLESAVVGIDDAEYGQCLNYFLVLNSDMNQEEIIQDINKLIPKSLRPSCINIVSQLPRNQIGKLKRHELQPSRNTQTPPHA